MRSADMGNAFAFLKALPHGPNVPVDYEIWTVLLNANNQVLSVGPVVSTLSQDFKAIEDFDIARTRNALLIAANYPTTGRFVEFNLGTRQLIDKGGPGSRPSYSADDSRIIYREAVKGGAYITSLDPGTGLSTRLTAMGNVSAPDARP